MKARIRSRIFVLLGLGLLISSLSVDPVAAVSRDVRGTTNTNINRNTNVNKNTNVNRNGTGNQSVNVNRNVNVNQNVNVNRNVNMHHNVNVDVDYHNDYNQSVGRAVATTAAVVATAAVVGSIAHSLPPACQTVVVNGVTYQNCGGAWYQPQYAGTTVQYVVVTAPR
jgi:hypothetical protein